MSLAGLSERIHGRSAASLLLTMLILVTPTAGVVLLFQTLFRSTIVDFVPAGATWNDEVYYWHQAATYSQVGLAGGYYTYEELPPRSSGWVRFGAWGPAYPVLYGTAGRMLGGWKPYTGIVINLVAMTAAYGVFVALVDPDVRQLLVLELFSLVWWPTWFYLAFSSSYAFIYACSIIIAALFYRLIQLRQTPSTQFEWLALAFLVGASTVRPQIAILSFPLFFITLRDGSWRSQGLAVLKGIGVVGLAYLFMILFSSSYPYAPIFSQAIGGVGFSVPGMARDILSNITWNTVDLITYHLVTPSAFFSGLVWWNIGLTGQLFVTLLAATVAALLSVRLARKTAAGFGPIEVELLFHVFNLASILAIVTTVYTASLAVNYAPCLLVSYLLLIAFRHWRAAAAVVLCNLGFMVLFPGTFHEWRSANFQYDAPQLAQAQNALAGVVRYQPGADPWCNTLLSASAPFTFPEMISIPPGIGYSVHLGEAGDPYLALPVKSRYVLVAAGTAPPLQWGNLELLAASSVGNLYVNWDSPCQQT
jgi:hypothetical protein